MALKNFSKIEIKSNEKAYWKIYKLDGTEVIPFSAWCLFIQQKYAYTTRDKYSQVVAKFLDYLVEANIFEEAVTRLELKEAVDNYKLLLHVGKSVSDSKLKKIALELDFNKIAPASWSNNISAINSFLKYVFENEEDEREYWAVKHGVNIPVEFREILPELNRITTLNNFQKEAIKQKSFFANVCRKVGEIKVSAGIKVDVNVKSNVDLKRLDFPAVELPKLLANTSCYRDRAIYAKQRDLMRKIKNGKENLDTAIEYKQSEISISKIEDKVNLDIRELVSWKFSAEVLSAVYEEMKLNKNLDKKFYVEMPDMVKSHLTKVSVSNEKEYILTRLADANSYSQFNNPENKYRSELLRKDIVRNLNLIDYEDLNVTELQKIEVFCAMIKNMLESNHIGLNKLVEYDCFKTIEQQKNKQDKLFNNKQILLLK